MGILQTLAREFAPDPAAPLADLRARAFAHARQRGVPTPRDEAWKYTDLQGHLDGDYLVNAGPNRAAPSAVPLLDATPYRLVFIDDTLAPDLAAPALPPGVRLRTLAAVLAEDPASLRALMARHAGEDANFFTALNMACARVGVVIELAAGCQLTTPLLIAFLHTGAAEQHFSAPLVIVNAGPNSQLTLIELHHGDATATNLSTPLTDLTAGAGSSIEHYRLQLEGAGAVHIGSVQATIERDARVGSHSFAFGSKLARVEICAKLAAPGAAVVLNGLFSVGAGQHIDHQTRIDHQAPHTTSVELYKGLAAGDGRGVFRGQVIVQPHAQKISARQASHNLLLSPFAEIDTKPELEIYADDVTCAHGATVGQLDDAALFYLCSRGIPAAEAHALLTFGFTQEVVEQVSFEPLRRLLAARLTGSADIPLPERIEPAS